MSDYELIIKNDGLYARVFDIEVKLMSGLETCTGRYWFAIKEIEEMGYYRNGFE